MNGLFAKPAAAMAAFMLSGALAYADDVETYEVSKVRYNNNGAYHACIYIDWRNSKDKHRRSYENHCAGAGGSTTWHLKNVRDEGDRSIEAREEIWGFINITGGDYEKCRKDGKKFVYDPDGGEVIYKTGGTSLNKNRCQIEKIQ